MVYLKTVAEVSTEQGQTISLKITMEETIWKLLDLEF